MGLHCLCGTVGPVAESQGWMLRRMLSFTNNRLINRPNRPRCPTLIRYCREIGFEWPEPEEPEPEQPMTENEEDPNDPDFEDPIGEGEQGESEPEGEFEDDVVCRDTPEHLSGGNVSEGGTVVGVEVKEKQPSQPKPPAGPALQSPASNAMSPEVLKTPEPRTHYPCEMTPEAVEVPSRHFNEWFDQYFFWFSCVGTRR